MAAETVSTRPTNTTDRRQQILAMTTEQGFCTTVELANHFGVSDMTIRRDIQKLVGDGLLRSVHGGVTMLPAAALEGSGDFRDRYGLERDSKSAIAREATKFVERGTAVAFDAGSTVLRVAELLPRDLELNAITHSLPVLTALLNMPNVEAYGLGGNLNKVSQSFGGPATVAALEHLRVHTLLLAASSVSEHGVFCGTDLDALTKRELVKISNRIVLLADSTKFRRTAMVRACALEVIDHVVTDDGLTEEDAEMLARHDVRVTVVASAHEHR